jgi:hypothetical protein
MNDVHAAYRKKEISLVPALLSLKIPLIYLHTTDALPAAALRLFSIKFLPAILSGLEFFISTLNVLSAQRVPELEFKMLKETFYVAWSNIRFLMKFSWRDYYCRRH